jgi:hypothetical protein
MTSHSLPPDFVAAVSLAARRNAWEPARGAAARGTRAVEAGAPLDLFGMAN